MGAIRGPAELEPTWLWAEALPYFGVQAIGGRECWAPGALLIRLGVEEWGRAGGRSV